MKNKSNTNLNLNTHKNQIETIKDPTNVLTAQTDLDNKQTQIKVKRVLNKLDEQALFYKENGIKKFYEATLNTNFNLTHSNVK